jgi:4-hydroxymandelate oxidase
VFSSEAATWPGKDGALYLRRAQRRVFGAAPELAPQHRAALGVFLTDLVRPYGLALHEDIPDGHTYGEMAAELIASLVQPHEPVDVLVLAFAIPDMRPGRATATYLSHVCPGGPLAFAICDQGTAAAFTGLRLAREYLRAETCDRALLLVVEQAVLPYSTEARATVPDKHAAIGFLCGRSGTTRLRAVEQYPNVTAGQAAEVLIRETEAARTPATVILGAGLADMADGLAASRVEVAPLGQPHTGAWWWLAAQLEGGEVLVADYDPLLRYLCIAAFTSTSADVAGV